MILVERLGSQRSLIRPYYHPRNREWKWSLYPIGYHGLNENPYIFLWDRKEKRKKGRGLISGWFKRSGA